MTIIINGIELSDQQTNALVYAIGAGENSIQLKIKKKELKTLNDKNKAVYYEMALSDIRKMIHKKD